MKSMALCVMPAVAGLVLASVTPTIFAQATSAAESSCMSAVNSHYNGRVNTLRVVRSEFSQANSEVILEADGESWRCLSSNDGHVEELSLQGGRSDSYNSGNNGGYQQSEGHGSGVILFRDYNFHGGSETVYGDVPDLARTSIGNDSLSSIEVPGNCRVTLYADNNYRGVSVELYGNEAELGRTAVGNDRASSMRVNCSGGGGYQQAESHSSGVTLYRDYNFRGGSETVYGDVPDLARTSIGNDSLSSIQVPGNCRVTLYADNNYRGVSVELYGNEAELGRTAVGNDRASSMQVDCR